mmetsp:Transcript_11008/g.16626  ORF Transcript_11008/g.16626 Transcript_11008/m.16626 type:complete len:202 (-) Transcript_11008:952-1557(-)
MSSTSITLTPFKIPVRCRCTAFLRLQLIRIHCQTHGASGFPPIKSSFNQNLIQTLIFSLLLYKPRSRYDHGVNSLRNLTSNSYSCHRANVFDTTVRTGSNENLLDGLTLNLLSFFETDILQRSGDSSLTCSIMPFRSNQRNISIHRNSILRTRTPSNSRSNVLGINNNLAIIHSIPIALQRRPVLARGIPLLASGTHRSTL